MLGDGEPARGRGEGERGGQGRPDPRLVQVDPGDPAGPGLGGQRQLIQHPVGQEADIGAVQGDGEPVRHPGQPAMIWSNFQAAAAAQLFGVVHGGLEAQDVLALGIGLQLHARTDPEPAQPIPWFLDHDLLRGRPALAAAVGPRLEPEQGPDRRDVQPAPGAVRIRSNRSSICCPDLNSRFREYSAW